MLASLTTNPARVFQGCEEGQGRERDLTPISWSSMATRVADVRNLAKVAYTIRAGEVIYRKP